MADDGVNYRSFKPRYVHVYTDL